MFFSGIPYNILAAWRDGPPELIVSPEILEEYRRVGEEMEAKSLDAPVCTDPDDDKFLACALDPRLPFTE
jgi:predicted nucleic acid-binding protein